MMGKHGTRRNAFRTSARTSCLSEPLERRVLLDAMPVGPEFRVNTFTAENQQSGAVARDADGDLVVAWSSYSQDGSYGGIYAQRYNAAGAAQGSEFRVNTFTTNDQSSPAIAMDGDGDFVITWQSYEQDGSGVGIYAQRYNASGVPQGGEFPVNTFTTGDQGSAAVAMDAEGNFVIAWTSNGQDGDGGGIYAQRYNAAGVPQGGEFRVNTSTTGEQGAPAIAMGGDVAMDGDPFGFFTVLWESFIGLALGLDAVAVGQDGGFVGGSVDVYAQRYNADGVPQGGEFRVNTFTTSDQSSPAIAMDGDGDFVATWMSNLQDGNFFGIYAQRFNASGVPQGGEFRVNTFTTSSQQSPAIAMDDDGDFVITWMSYAQDGNGEGIYAQGYNAAGVPQGGEFRVNTFTTNGQRFPSVAMDGDGDFVVAWSSYGQDGHRDGMYAQRYTNAPAAPAVNASSFLFNNAPHRLAYTFSQNVSASLGTDDIVLENLTTMQTVPSSELSLSYDLKTNTATFSYIGPGGLITSVLPDGNYRATLLAAGITNAQGVPLPANHVFTFFFLNGDATRDRRVNLADFNILAANFGQSNRTFSQGDFNYDGTVNLNDFNILASRFGQVVGPSPADGTDPHADDRDESDVLDEVLG